MGACLAITTNRGGIQMHELFPFANLLVPLSFFLPLVSWEWGWTILRIFTRKGSCQDFNSERSLWNSAADERERAP